MKKIFLGCSLLVALTLFFSADASAAIINPTVDGTVFDGVGGLYDGVGDFVNATGWPQAMHTTLGESRGIMEFDLSGISDPVSTAWLKLSVAEEIVSPSFTLDVYTYNADGSLVSTDYALGSLSQSLTYNGQSLLSLDVTSAVQDAKGASQTWLGFNFRKREADPAAPGTPFVAFNSLEHPPVEELLVNEPVAAVPEPASLLLLGSGLAVFATRRKK